MRPAKHRDCREASGFALGGRNPSRTDTERCQKGRVDPVAPPPSLIQQRFSLERARAWARWALLASLVLAVGTTVQLALDGGDAPWWRWFGLVFWWVGVAVCARRLIRNGRSVRSFEEAHGRDAGKQRPVGR